VQRIGKLQNCRFINSFRMMKTGEEEEGGGEAIAMNHG
jgi:hypothetical protein